MSFSNLKTKNSLSYLKTAIDNMNNKETYTDDRFWSPTTDKVGNGSAIIRFLDTPMVDGDNELPWIKLYSHGFQGVGGWYISDCPTTIGKECPVNL